MHENHHRRHRHKIVSGNLKLSIRVGYQFQNPQLPTSLIQNLKFSDRPATFGRIQPWTATSLIRGFETNTASNRYIGVPEFPPTATAYSNIRGFLDSAPFSAKIGAPCFEGIQGMVTAVPPSRKSQTLQRAKAISSFFSASQIIHKHIDKLRICSRSPRECSLGGVNGKIVHNRHLR
jgi:hypothetical protein